MGTIGTVVPAADGASGGGSGLLILALPLLLVGWLYWSQNRRMKALRSFSDSLVVGDAVVLSSGLFGTIQQLDDTSAQLEIAPGVSVRVDRRAIAMKQAEVAPVAPDESAPEAGE